MACKLLLRFGWDNVPEVLSAFGIEPRGDGKSQETQLRLLFDEVELVDGASWTATATRAEGGFAKELRRLAGTGVTFLGKRWEDSVKGVVFIRCVRGSMTEDIWSGEQHARDKMTGLDWALQRLDTEIDDAAMLAQALWSKYGEGEGIDPAVLQELKRALAASMLLVMSMEPPGADCPHEVN